MRLQNFRHSLLCKRFSDLVKPENPSTIVKVNNQNSSIVKVDIASGAPPSLTQRRVYIYQPSRNVTQSGLLHANSWWQVDFENGQARWENPLMGWTSSRDPVQGVSLKFKALEDAIRFAQRQGWHYTISESNESSWKRKSYADNFTYSPDKLKLVRTK